MFIHFFFILFTILCPASLLADSQIIFDAETMDRRIKDKTITLEGNVNVIFEQQQLLCNKAVIHQDTKTIVAEGNVILQTPKTTLRGESIEFNYEKNTGTLKGGIITSGQVLIESDSIEKVGEEEYIAEEAYYTACLTCPPSWGFTASRVRAEIGGYAYIRRPWLHLMQFPVLPLPYLVVPLNSKRQTGILVPRPGQNSYGGFTFEVPFFWAIDRSHDATLSLVSYEFLGVQAKGNYRYVIDSGSSGELNTAFMNDRKVDRNRWYVDYSHHYKLPNNYVQRTDIQLTSDRNYTRDFPQQFNYAGQPALDNRASITKNYENAHLSLDSSYYVNLLEEKISSDNKRSLHRQPEINYRYMDQKILEDHPLYFDFEAQYLNISRQDVSFDHIKSNNLAPGSCVSSVITQDKNGNNITTPVDDASDICVIKDGSAAGFQYQPDGAGGYGDLIRTGQRLDMQSSVHYPLWVGKTFDIDPKVKLRWTQYSLSAQSDPTPGVEFNSFPSRFYAQYGISTKTYFSKIFKWSNDYTIKHSIIPEVHLQYTPQVHQTKSHFFGNTNDISYFREKQPIDDTDLDWRNGGRGIQFDNRDRIIGRKIVNIGFTSKILGRENKKNNDQNYNQYKQNLFFSLYQAYDLQESEQGSNGRPWQDILGTFRFQNDFFQQSIEANHFPYHKLTNFRSSSSFRFNGSNSFDISYAKLYNISEDTFITEQNRSSRTHSLTLGTGFNYRYIYFYGSLEYYLDAKNFGKNENPWKRWSTRIILRPPGECWTVNAFLSRQLDTGELTKNISMEFQFGK